LTGDYGILFYGTAALLVSAMVGLEFYRLRAGKRGRFRRFVTGEAAFGLAPRRAEVELDDGRVVEATVPGCTQCVCRFQAGDAVVVTTAAGRYYVGAGAGRIRRRERQCAREVAPDTRS
jgi:translation initiation factor IF-1